MSISKVWKMTSHFCLLHQILEILRWFFFLLLYVKGIMFLCGILQTAASPIRSAGCPGAAEEGSWSPQKSLEYDILLGVDEFALARSGRPRASRKRIGLGPVCIIPHRNIAGLPYRKMTTFRRRLSRFWCGKQKHSVKSQNFGI